jgi:PPOX class probable F420-dependent enzyme
LEYWSNGFSELQHSNTPLLQHSQRPVSLAKKYLAFIRSARVAHLATTDKSGQPLVIPICFVFDGREFFSPVDEKPKNLAAAKLKRVRNIRENSRISLVIDRYNEDWQRLAYILVSGQAKILSAGQKHRRAVSLLRKKYSQYRAMALEERPMIVITPMRFKHWGSL